MILMQFTKTNCAKYNTVSFEYISGLHIRQRYIKKNKKTASLKFLLLRHK